MQNILCLKIYRSDFTHKCSTSEKVHYLKLTLNIVGRKCHNFSKMTCFPLRFPCTSTNGTFTFIRQNISSSEDDDFLVWWRKFRPTNIFARRIPSPDKGQVIFNAGYRGGVKQGGLPKYFATFSWGMKTFCHILMGYENIFE